MGFVAARGFLLLVNGEAEADRRSLAVMLLFAALVVGLISLGLMALVMRHAPQVRRRAEYLAFAAVAAWLPLVASVALALAGGQIAGSVDCRRNSRFEENDIDRPTTTRHAHHEFLAASDKALVDENLQSSLSLLGSSLGHRNAEAFAAFAGSAQMREKARAIKDATLAELDKHLETLEASVQARGGQVHFAADGADACRIIVDILQKSGVRRAVKSKSMTTEEIHLNPALEAAGIEPIETDFGEYIIQVAGQRPSHIVAPAIHLRATHVAEILSPVAGETLPPDATRLAAFARKRLRDAFATADAGHHGRELRRGRDGHDRAFGKRRQYPPLDRHAARACRGRGHRKNHPAAWRTCRCS